MFDILLEDGAKALENGEDLRRNVVDVGTKLFESRYKDRYPSLGNMFESADPRDQYTAGDTCIVLRNQELFMENVKKKYGEAVVVSKLGDLAPRIMDVTRIFYPNQISHIITSMQPLTTQVGQIVVVRPSFVSSAAGVTANDEIFVNQTTGEYASEQATHTFTGDGSTVTFATTLTYHPMRPKLCQVFLDSVLVGTDNGSTGFTKVVGSTLDDAVSTINLTSGAISLHFTSAPASSKSIEVVYWMDTETDATLIREVEIGLRIIPVQAKEHPLKISWSVPAAFAASASVGLDVEDTLSVLAAQFIKTERDRFIINYIARAAGAADSDLTFDCTHSDSYTKRQKYQDFKIILSIAENKVFTAAGRGSITWLIGGANVCAMIKQIDGFIPDSGVVPIGAHVIGTLDGITIIKDPGMNTNTYLVGYNGLLPGDAGVVFSEWIPIYFTPTITDTDLKGRKAVLSMYDVVTNMTAYYKKGVISAFNQ